MRVCVLPTAMLEAGTHFHVIATTIILHQFPTVAIVTSFVAEFMCYQQLTTTSGRNNFFLHEVLHNKANKIVLPEATAGILRLNALIHIDGAP